MIEIVTRLGRYSVTSKEARALLDLMNRGYFPPSIPKTFVDILARTSPSPHHYIDFNSVLTDAAMTTPAVATTATNNNNYANDNVIRGDGGGGGGGGGGDGNTAAGGGALVVDMNDLAWPPVQGFTVSTWFRIADRMAGTAGRQDGAKDRESITIVDVRGIGNGGKDEPGFTVKVDPTTGRVEVTLIGTRASKGEQIFRLAAGGSGIEVNQWIHLVVTHAPGPAMFLRSPKANLTLYIDGIKREKVSAPCFNGSSSRNVRSIFNAGTGGRRGSSSLQMGNYHLLRHVISTAEALVMYASGPNISSFHNNLPLSPLLARVSKFGLETGKEGTGVARGKERFPDGRGPLTNLVIDILDAQPSLDELGKKIICFVRPRDGWVFQERLRPSTPANHDVTDWVFQEQSLRPMSPPPSPQARNGGGGGGGGGTPRNSNDFGSLSFGSGNAFLETPENRTQRLAPQGGYRNTLPPRPDRQLQNASGRLKPLSFPRLAKHTATMATGCEAVQGTLFPPAHLCHRRGLSEAVNDVGGMHAFLYLLGSMPPCEHDQAHVLDFIFRLMRHSPENTLSLAENEGYLLLNHFLRSERAVVGYRMVDVLLREAISDPSWDNPHAATDEPTLTSSVSEWAIVTNVDVFVHVFLDWRIFDTANTPLPAWKRVCNSFVRLIDPSFNHCATINAHLLRKAGAMQKLLFIIQEERTHFPGQITLAFVRMLYFLMEASEDEAGQYKDMVALVEYLVASHPQQKMRKVRPNFTASLKSRPMSLSDMHASLSSYPSTPASGTQTPNTSMLSTTLETPEKSVGDASSHGGGGGADDASHPSPSPPRRSTGYANADLITPPASPNRSFAFAERVRSPLVLSPGTIRKKIRESPPPFGAYAAAHTRAPRTPNRSWLTSSSEDRAASEAAAGDNSFVEWQRSAEDEENASTSVRLGIIRLLLDRVAECPKKLIAKLQGVLSVKILLALADHESVATRITVVRLIDNLMRTPGATYAAQLAAANGFRVLTNQLRQHSVTEELFVACADLFTGQTPYAGDRPPPTEDLGFGVSRIYFVHTVDRRAIDRGFYFGQPDSTVVLIAFLDKAVKNARLCVSIIAALHEIFVKRPELRAVMLDSNLVTTICDVVVSSVEDVVEEFAGSLLVASEKQEKKREARAGGAAAVIAAAASLDDISVFGNDSEGGDRGTNTPAIDGGRLVGATDPATPTKATAAATNAGLAGSTTPLPAESNVTFDGSTPLSAGSNAAYNRTYNISSSGLDDETADADNDADNVVFTDELQSLLFAHIDAFLIDIAEYACTLMRVDTLSVKGVALVEDVVDAFGECGLPPSYARHFQIMVLHTALDSFCLLSSGGGLQQKRVPKAKLNMYYSHPAHALTGMSIDVIVAAVTTLRSQDGRVLIRQPAEDDWVQLDVDASEVQVTSTPSKANLLLERSTDGLAGDAGKDYNGLVKETFQVLRGLVLSSDLSTLELHEIAAAHGAGAGAVQHDSIIDQLGILVVFLLHPSQPSFLVQYTIGLLATYLRLVDKLADNGPVYNEVFISVLEFWTKVTEQMPPTEAGDAEPAFATAPAASKGAAAAGRSGGGGGNLGQQDLLTAITPPLPPGRQQQPSSAASASPPLSFPPASPPRSPGRGKLKEPAFATAASQIMNRMVRTHLQKLRTSIDVEKSELGPDNWAVVLTVGAAKRRHQWLCSLIDGKSVSLTQRGFKKSTDLAEKRAFIATADTGALDVTSVTIEAQDDLRRVALQEVQHILETDARIQSRWRQLGETVTQPRSIWAVDRPGAVWIMDPTEGPLRMRLRLAQIEVVGSWPAVGRSAMPQPVEAEKPEPVPFVLESTAATVTDVGAGSSSGNCSGSDSSSSSVGVTSYIDDLAAAAAEVGTGSSGRSSNYGTKGKSKGGKKVVKSSGYGQKRRAVKPKTVGSAAAAATAAESNGDGRGTPKKSSSNRKLSAKARAEIFAGVVECANQKLGAAKFPMLEELGTEEAFGICSSLLDAGVFAAVGNGTKLLAEVDNDLLDSFYDAGKFAVLRAQGLAHKACATAGCKNATEYFNSTCKCWACIECLCKTQGACPKCKTKKSPFEKQSSAAHNLIEYLTTAASSENAEDQGIGGGLQPGEQLRGVYGCKLVSPFTIKAGELLMGRDAFYFKEDPNAAPQPGQGHSQAKQPLSIINLGTLSRDPAQLPYWLNARVQEVHDRRYLLQRTALEIFLIDGTTIFVAFDSTAVRNEARDVLLQQDLPNVVDYSNTVNGSMTRDSITQRWVKGTMSNFEYLMHINKLAGRSFNDLTQYPILPYILKDYTSKRLEFDDPKSYRDLNKPMGAQDPERLQKFLRKYRDLVELEDEHGPYHYGSHYSSVGSVLHYLVRLEPFTQLFLELQSGKFDFADRTFFSIDQSWNLSSKISPADVKELTPEFFFLPEFLLNANGCPFGETQNGHLVDNVVLPPWAKGSARRFIRMHRRALESDHVSKQLNAWIDLVFGAKQKGPAAVEAHNLFLPQSYEGNIDIDAVEDDVDREAQWAIVRSFGQTPKQLLTKSHVSRVATTDRFTFWGQEHMRAVVMWHRTVSAPVYQINTTKVGEVLALGPCKALIYSGNNYTFLLWGTWDDALRVCSLDTGKTLSIFKSLHDEQIQCVAAPADDTLCCVGGSSGVLSIFHINKTDKKCPVLELIARIPGHNAAIASIGVSRSVSLVVTGSEDGTAIVWDLNRRTHVHTLDKHEGPVSALAICDSTGDIVTVCSMSNKDAHMVCRLRLWSVNASLIATVTSDTFINCVAVSSLTNGYSENVVVGGLDDGSVMLWESLDLAPIIKLSDPRFPAPVVSVHFSDEDATTLVTGMQDGSVICWSQPRSGRRLPYFSGRGSSTKQRSMAMADDAGRALSVGLPTLM